MLLSPRLLLVLSLGLPLSAQKAPDEASFHKDAAHQLDAFATLCFKNDYPKRAREVWLEVIAEYDKDDATARAALGFDQVGTAWQPRRDFEYPEQDTPNAVVANMLHKKWEGIAKELGEGHRALGQALQAAGNQDRARHHFDRALRFLPDDGKAAAALGHQNFEGFVGTIDEVAILRRSRLMDRAVAAALEKPFPAEPAKGDLHPVLQTGGVPVIGVQTANFTVYGDWEESVLAEAAACAERSLQFCTEAYAGIEGWPPQQPPSRTFAFFQQKDTWAKVVRANAARVGADRVEFIVANASANKVGSGRDGIRLAGVDNVETVRDLAVRWVAQEYSQLAGDGMVEGIGHAVVGLFFGRNLVFTVGQEEQRGTQASRTQQKLLLPDLEVWKDLAVEMAWQRSGTRAAQLPLLKAASFPSDGRIKAWAFCDYLLRLDPILLRELDRTAAKARHENDVRESFQQATSRAVDELEEGWRALWTVDSPLKRAIQQKVTPLEAVSKDAPKWLAEWNRLRALVGAAAAGWSAALSTDCRQHADYLKQSRARGPDAEHTQEPGKPGYSNIGRTFAEGALVSVGDKDPKKAMADWLHWPGYRDALLNKNVDTLGLFVDGNVCVIDADRGRAAQAQAAMAQYPFVNVTGNRHRDPVPAMVDVADMGAEVAALLREHGRGKAKQVGYPLSLHGYGGDLGKVECQVSIGGAPVEGVLVNTGGGGSRRSSARGMWVFWPLDPLKRGAEVRVFWTWRGGSQEVIFTTQ